MRSQLKEKLQYLKESFELSKYEVVEEVKKLFNDPNKFKKLVNTVVTSTFLFTQTNLIPNLYSLSEKTDTIDSKTYSVDSRFENVYVYTRKVSYFLSKFVENDLKYSDLLIKASFSKPAYDLKEELDFGNEFIEADKGKRKKRDKNIEAKTPIQINVTKMI